MEVRLLGGRNNQRKVLESFWAGLMEPCASAGVLLDVVTGKAVWWIQPLHLQSHISNSSSHLWYFSYICIAFGFWGYSLISMLLPTVLSNYSLELPSRLPKSICKATSWSTVYSIPAYISYSWKILASHASFADLSKAHTYLSYYRFRYSRWSHRVIMVSTSKIFIQ